MKISVIGCGWFGLPLSRELLLLGHELKGTTRNKLTQNELINLGMKIFELEAPVPAPAELLECDLVILNIPPTAAEVFWFKSWPWPQKKPWLIFISSTSGKLGEYEEWVQAQFQHWSILRFAGLVGKDRHPGNILSGKKALKGGHWPVNLLHQDDAVGFTLKVIESGIKSEIINVLCDEHHTRKEFYQEYSQRIGIPLCEFDPIDDSTKAPLENHRAREIYEFKWPIIFGKSL